MYSRTLAALASFAIANAAADNSAFLFAQLPKYHPAFFADGAKAPARKKDIEKWTSGDMNKRGKELDLSKFAKDLKEGKHAQILAQQDRVAAAAAAALFAELPEDFPAPRNLSSEQKAKMAKWINQNKAKRCDTVDHTAIEKTPAQGTVRQVLAKEDRDAADAAALFAELPEDFLAATELSPDQKANMAKWINQNKAKRFDTVDHTAIEKTPAQGTVRQLLAKEDRDAADAAALFAELPEDFPAATELSPAQKAAVGRWISANSATRGNAPGPSAMSNSQCQKDLAATKSALDKLTSSSSNTAKTLADLQTELSAAKGTNEELQGKLLLTQGRSNVAAGDESQRLKAEIDNLKTQLAAAKSSGAGSVDVEAVTKAKEAAEKALKEAEDSSSKKMWVAIIVSSVVFVLSGVGAFFYLRGRV